MCQSPVPEATRTTAPAMSDPTSLTVTPADVTPTPQGHPRVHGGHRHAVTGPLYGNVNSHTFPGASFASATPETRPETTLSITVSPVPPDIPECHRSEWNHRNNEDGDCQDARQEVLASESVVEVTFESDRNSRVASGGWYGAFTGNYIDAPGELDIDHLVPLKNAHDSGG